MDIEQLIQASAEDLTKKQLEQARYLVGRLHLYPDELVEEIAALMAQSFRDGIKAALELYGPPPNAQSENGQGEG